MNKSNKLTTMAVVAVMMATALGGAFMISDDDFTEESDAAVPLIPLLIFFIGGAFVGVVAWDLYTKTDGQGQADTYTRQVEAGKVAESIGIVMTDYHNALNNYINVWKFTNEHFIRTSEITAAAVWSQDAEYHPTDVLVPAGVYQNSAHMMTNASAQISAYFQNMNKRLNLWNNDPVYQDMMTLEWRYGNTAISTKDNFGGHLKTTASITSESADKVYLSGGEMWVFGGTSTLKSATGTTLTLPAGMTDLDTISNFEPGIYELQSGRQYAGDMLYIIDSESASITPGIVMIAGSTVKLATLYDNKVMVDGAQYNTLEIGIVPQGGNRVTATVHDSSKPAESALVKYRSMHSSVNSTIGAANYAASTVWNIFDKAGETSVYLTTLMVPNFYEEIQITQAQQELITTMAMIQLADYVKTHEKEISAGDYSLSGGSFNLFVRGDLVDAFGNILYKDVIYTPFYFVSDATLKTGNNAVTQPAIIAIWTESGGHTLSSWNFTSSTEVAALISMTNGESMYVYEILYDDEFVSHVELDVKQIDIIVPGEYPIYIPERLNLGDKDIIQLLALILMILGALAAITVFLHKRLGIALGGVICIVIGFVIMSFQDSWFGGLL